MKTRMTLTVLTLAAALEAAGFTALPAMAQDAPPPPMAPVGIEMFEAMDINSDGTVTAQELLEFRKASVIGIDANADGKLSTQELAARELAEMTRMANARAARMVAERDVDGDGLLSVEEMAARPMPMGMIARIDTDGDGAITRAEFDAAQERMAQRRGEGHGEGRGPGGKGHGGKDRWGGHDRAMPGDAPPPPPPPADGDNG